MPTEQFAFYSVREAARSIGVSVCRVHQLIRAGKIRTHRLGEGPYVIPPLEVERYKEDREQAKSGPRKALPKSILSKLDDLAKPDRDMIERYYGIGRDHQTYRAIACLYGVSRQAVHYRVHRNLQKLARP